MVVEKVLAGMGQRDWARWDIEHDPVVVSTSEVEFDAVSEVVVEFTLTSNRWAVAIA